MKFNEFLGKMKQKAEERSYKDKEKKAKAKGFSSYHVYETQTAISRKEGYDEAQSKLRKTELKRAKEEEYNDALDTKPKYVKKVQKGIGYIKQGAGQYNEMMNELRGLSNNQGFNKGNNSEQGYASGYGPYEPRQSRQPRQKEQSFAQMFGMQEPRKPRKKHSKKKKAKRRKKKKESNDFYSYLNQR